MVHHHSSTPTHTPDKPPARRLALLEARLAATAPSPTTPASTSRKSPARSSPSSPPASSDSVHSFSSAGAPAVSSASPSSSSPLLPPPPPPLQSHPMTKTTAPSPSPPPPPRSKGAVKKRKRSHHSAALRTARVDDFFKPAVPNFPSISSTPTATPSNTTPAPTSARPFAAANTLFRPLRVEASASAPHPVDPFSNNNNNGSAHSFRHLRALVDRLTLENASLKQSAATADDLRVENEDLRTQLDLELPQLRAELDDKQEQLREAERRVTGLQQMVEELAVTGERLRRQVASRHVVEGGERIGLSVVDSAQGLSAGRMAEVWQDGREWKEVEDALQQIANERDGVDRRRKDMGKKKKIVEVPGATGGYEQSGEYAVEMDEVCKVRITVLKREENALLERRLKLGRERDLLVREVRRQTDERQSRFGECETLNERYVLLNLLGRGGFSEVFKAVDLREGRFVACKIHMLSSNWNEEKKRNYVKHAMREYDIHKSLRHPRVVRLLDIFEIDENGFCTVLEYCDGCDLDAHLRLHKTLSEKEARSITMQVFAGLRYLGEQPRPVIHYDLKPGNILLRKGEVQITDFGLSKTLASGGERDASMELTSQGAGTMWYLPPECFETAGEARISPKVDVWSAGVVLFQMLYGKKPFGQDQTQETMFREKTALRQRLVFPAKPPVSSAAKDFVSLCLTRSVAERPPVRDLLAHPFLGLRSK